MMRFGINIFLVFFFKFVRFYMNEVFINIEYVFEI